MTRTTRVLYDCGHVENIPALIQTSAPGNCRRGVKRQIQELEARLKELKEKPR